MLRKCKLALLLTPLLVVPLAGAAPATAAQDAQGQATQRFEVTSARTDTTTVYRNADGSYTSTVHSQPVRVRRDGAWHDIDPTLHRGADGTVRPAATAVDLTFSGGGDGPMAVLRDGTRSLSLIWPGRLPAPILRGDTATYPGVLPGVDLVLRAGRQGVSQVLVVKDRRAAANPALRSLRLGTSTTGLTLAADAAGNLAATDAAGETVFQAPTPHMWDSGGAADAHPVSGPASGARVATMGVALAPGTMTIAPDSRLLDDPDVVYPVHIDPEFTGGRTGWTSVWKTFPTTKYWNASDVARVGYLRAGDNADDHRDHTNRSYFNFNTSFLKGRTISRAVFRAFENHSFSCTARPVQLVRTSAANANTTWNNQPLNTSGRLIAEVNVAKGYSSGCPDGGVDFNALSAVQEAAGNNWDALTLALRSKSESGDSLGWKKFNNNPVLEVTYNTTPNTPTGLGTTPTTPCRTGTVDQRPYVNTDASNGMVLRATASDPDAGFGQRVRAHFQWWFTGGGLSGEQSTALAVSGSPFSVTIPRDRLPHHIQYSWRVQAVDETGKGGPWSAWCEFVVDVVAPALPTVAAAGPFTVGVPAPFTFTPAGTDTDVVGYRWGLNTGTALPNYTPVNGAGGTASVPIAPTILGPNTLAVVAVDRAGNEARLDDGYTPFRFFAEA